MLLNVLIFPSKHLTADLKLCSSLILWTIHYFSILSTPKERQFIGSKQKIGWILTDGCISAKQSLDRTGSADYMDSSANHQPISLSVNDLLQGVSISTWVSRGRLFLKRELKANSSSDILHMWNKNFIQPPLLTSNNSFVSEVSAT